MSGLRDLRDGLDDAARAILARLGEEYVAADRIVGDDEYEYDVLVALVQDFTLRYPLAGGLGNFGSVDGDPAAEPEYTEVRIAPIAHELGTFPNVLVNGGGRIPPHNLREVAAAVVACLDAGSVELSRLLELMPGPDFPTGGIVVDRTSLPNAYATGRGELRLRARARVQGTGILITELPYGVEKGGDEGVIAEMIERSAEGELPRLAALTDRSDRGGMRVLVGFAPDVDPGEALGLLYGRTSLEVTIPIDLAVLVDDRPVRLSLPELVERWLAGRDPDEVRRDLAAVAERFGDARRTQLGL